MKTAMQGITEMAMARAIGMGILYAITPDAEAHQARMQRVISWAANRYGLDWALPRTVALGQLSIETAMRIREEADY